jgi:outer membrane protein insertion porin family
MTEIQNAKAAASPVRRAFFNPTAFRHPGAAATRTKSPAPKAKHPKLSSKPQVHIKQTRLARQQTVSPVGVWGLMFGVWSLLLGLLVSLCGLPAARAQLNPDMGSKVAKVQIKHVGPPAVSDPLVMANIRVKPGDPYLPTAVDEDVRNLYATGLFYNIRVSLDRSPEGLILTYIVQGNPRLTEIHFQGNKKFSDAKLRKLISSKAGEPLSERKLFTDAQEIQKKYQKSGYPNTKVQYFMTIVEETGRASARFEIQESRKVKIVEVDFIGAQAFPQKKLRKVIKTRKHWMFSWLTGSGYLKDEQFADDKEALLDYYRDHGYLDFEIKDVQFLNPTPTTMVIRFVIYEGTQYHVGSVKFTGNKIFSNADITNGLRQIHEVKREKAKIGPHGLTMDVGDIFRPKGLSADTEAVEDVYGSKGYIDVTPGRGLNVVHSPNTESGTMDLDFQIDEGQKSYIEKIEIRGNNKTKDKVIRRELTVSPGETFDMFRVKTSKQRLEGLGYFEKVDTRPETTEISPSHKNLIVSVDEKSTGMLTVGAGFSSVDALVGFADLTQGNFDLFHPPTFTGGGQKFRLHVALGTEQQDYEMSFVEPWFLGQKLALGVDLYYRDLAYLSPNNIYDEVRYGGRVSLTRALGSDRLIGSLSYTLEDVGINLNGGWHGNIPQPPGIPNPPQLPPNTLSANTPQAILDETGYHLLSRVGGSLAYDTRGYGFLPDKGQKTEFTATFTGGPIGGDKEFYKLEASTAWYFKGLVKGHVLELVGHAGTAESVQSGDVPFYDRFYLGGLWDLRGFKLRNIGPRDPNYGNPNYPNMANEPIGGDSYWFGSAEYSIPIFEQEHGVGVRFAFFYDIGNVMANPYTFNTSNFNDNWGLGLRLNLPIGPIRLDYGIPIHHDQFNSGSGQFQFGVGYTREFR